MMRRLGRAFVSGAKLAKRAKAAKALRLKEAMSTPKGFVQKKE